MLKKYTNQLLDLIIAEGFNINEFNLSRDQNHKMGDAAVIELVSSKLKFNILPQNSFNNFKVQFTLFRPNYVTIERPLQTREFIQIDGVKRFLKVWLNKEVKPFLKNKETPDHWKIIKKNPLVIEGINFNENEPFSVDEQESLKSGLDEIKFLVKQNFELNKKQIALTYKKINYLIDATKRLNKTDWKIICITTVGAIAYDLAFDDAKRETLYNLFSKIWSYLQLLPPPAL